MDLKTCEGMCKLERECVECTGHLEDASSKCINSLLLLLCTGTDPGFLERVFKFTKGV